MRKTSALALAVLLLAFTSNQVLTRGDIFSGINTTYAWSGSAQSWSASQQNLTCADWTAFVRNDGTACSPSTTNVTYGFASAHAIVTVVHSPILSNPTFSGGLFTSWTSANTSGCSGAVFTGQNSTDQDADAGMSGASSLSCAATPAVVTLNQTFSTSGIPTAQSYAFYYRAPTVTAGSGLCSPTSGVVSFTLKLNGTLVTTISPVMDNKWHLVSGSTALLVNGSNTLVVTATLTAATGQTYNIRLQSCTGNLTSPQPLYLDNFSLSAVW